MNELLTYGSPITAEHEWDILTTALNRYGIVHVAPARPRRRGGPRTPRQLFTRLFTSPEARLQQAAVLLLLTHPELASEACAAIDLLKAEQRDLGMRRYVAAGALQRMARTRIELSIGERPLVPPAYLEELGLPSLDLEFGRAALIELAEEEERRYGYDAWGTYRALLDTFLKAIRRRGWGVVCDSTLIKPA